MKKPERSELRSLRRKAVLDIVSKEELGTQQDIVRALRRRGIHATQVSVSRDMSELGLIKVGGHYRPGLGEARPDPELPLRTWVRRADPAGSHLVVVRCESGTAQGVARALDQVALPGVVGTVAGDDTIFIAVGTQKASDDVLRFLRSRLAAQP